MQAASSHGGDKKASSSSVSRKSEVRRLSRISGTYTEEVGVALSAGPLDACACTPRNRDRSYTHAHACVCVCVCDIGRNARKRRGRIGVYVSSNEKRSCVIEWDRLRGGCTLVTETDRSEDQNGIASGKETVQLQKA